MQKVKQKASDTKDATIISLSYKCNMNLSLLDPPAGERWRGRRNGGWGEGNGKWEMEYVQVCVPCPLNPHSTILFCCCSFFELPWQNKKKKNSKKKYVKNKGYSNFTNACTLEHQPKRLICIYVCVCVCVSVCECVK